MKSDMNIAFFGTPDIAVWVLEELEAAGILPSLVITNPDQPQGRKMVLTPPPVKVWANEHSIDVLQPKSLNDPTVGHRMSNSGWDLFVVAAYGKIIPKDILDIPKYGVLNVHPSLLPKYRGASPIRSAILNDDRETGVTIMQMDEKLDHGPILAQELIDIEENDWPMRGGKLDELLARRGGKLLAETIPEWTLGNIDPQEQEHDAATFCSKIEKSMGEINLEDDPYQNLLKIRAFDGWPGAFFFYEKEEKKIRVKIVDAELNSDNTLNILRVIPEGKKEMDYQEFQKAHSKNIDIYT